MNEDEKKQFYIEVEKYIKKYLRDYQGDAVRNVLDIFTSDDEFNRFASVVCPTGGGKSFIAMALFQMISNEKNFKADRL